MQKERIGNTVLRERWKEQCAEREIGGHNSETETGGKLCRERGWGNTVLRERLGNTVLRERLVEHCAEL